MEHAKDIGASIMAILTAIILVAIIGVLVSNSSQTANVISAFAKAFSQILGVVVSPNSGGSSSSSPDTSTQPGIVASNGLFTQATGNLQGGLAGVMALPFTH